MEKASRNRERIKMAEVLHVTVTGSDAGKRLDGFLAAVSQAVSKKDEGKRFSAVSPYLGLSLHAERRGEGYLAAISATPASMMGTIASETIFLEID